MVNARTTKTVDKGTTMKFVLTAVTVFTIVTLCHYAIPDPYHAIGVGGAISGIWVFLFTGLQEEE